MKRVVGFASVAALALLAGPGWTQVKIEVQPFPVQFGGGQLQLVGDKAVQSDLKVSDMQAKELAKLAEKQADALKGLNGRDYVQKMRELQESNKKAIAEILQPAQQKRLQQLELQQRGTGIFYDPTIANDLNITPDQRKEIADLIQKKTAEYNQRIVADVIKSLTPEQQKKWQDVAGEQFQGVLPRGGGASTGIIRLPNVQIQPRIQPKPQQ